MFSVESKMPQPEEEETVTIGEVIGAIEEKFDDGESIETKAMNALAQLPRTSSIAVIERVNAAAQVFSEILKGFVESKPDGYVVTGDDMNLIISEFQIKQKAPPH